MANGLVHEKNHRRYRLLSVCLAILVYILHKDLLLSVFVLYGYWLGLYIDPDLDMKNITLAERRWRNSYYFFWLTPWVKLYGLIATEWLGGHRSLLTHLPLLSTSLRMIWFSLPLIPAIYILTYIAGISVPLFLIKSATIGTFYGQSLSDTIHVIYDL